MYDLLKFVRDGGEGACSQHLGDFVGCRDFGWCLYEVQWVAMAGIADAETINVDSTETFSNCSVDVGVFVIVELDVPVRLVYDQVSFSCSTCSTIPPNPIP